MNSKRQIKEKIKFSIWKKVFFASVFLILISLTAAAQRYARTKSNIGINGGYMKSLIFSTANNSNSKNWDNGYSLGISWRMNYFVYPEINYINQKATIATNDTGFAKPSFDIKLNTINIPATIRYPFPLLEYHGKRACQVLLLVPSVAPSFNINFMNTTYHNSSFNNTNYNFGITYALGLSNFNSSKGRRSMGKDYFLEAFFTHLVSPIGKPAIEQKIFPIKNRYMGLRFVIIFYKTYKTSNMG